MTLVRDVAGMAALAELHEAVLLDQFGVLHHGLRAFPGAADCVARLIAGGVFAVAAQDDAAPDHGLGRRMARFVW